MSVATLRPNNKSLLFCVWWKLTWEKEREKKEKPTRRRIKDNRIKKHDFGCKHILLWEHAAPHTTQWQSNTQAKHWMCHGNAIENGTTVFITLHCSYYALTRLRKGCVGRRVILLATCKWLMHLLVYVLQMHAKHSNENEKKKMELCETTTTTTKV